MLFIQIPMQFQTFSRPYLPKILATPHSPNPVLAYKANPGDKIVATNTAAAKSDGSVTAYVIDPSKVTGAAYGVTFKDNPCGWCFLDFETRNNCIA